MVGEGYCKTGLWSLNITSFCCIVLVLGESALQSGCCQSATKSSRWCLGAARSVVGAASWQRRPALKLPDVGMNNWSSTFCRDIWSPFLLSPPHLTTDLSSAPSVCSNHGSVRWSRSTSAPPGHLRRFDAERAGQGNSAQWNTYVTHKFARHLAFVASVAGRRWRRMKIARRLHFAQC